MYIISQFFTSQELLFIFVSFINNAHVDNDIGIDVFALSHQITISFDVYRLFVFALVVFVKLNWFGFVFIFVGCDCCCGIVIDNGEDRWLKLSTLSCD
jgi:hypothetical protein